MKGLLTAGLAWLSADPLARFSLKTRANSPEAANPDSVSSGSTAQAVPANAQARPAVTVLAADGTQYQVSPATSVAQALYFMSNADNGDNYVYAYSIGRNGQVNTSVTPQRYATGGKGRVFSYTGSTVQDALDSQGSLIQSGARLYATNAGSNTITQFAVNCSNPLKLTNLGTVGVNGNFPNSIGAAPALRDLCAATTGSNAGLQCYTYSAGFGVGTIGPPQERSNTNPSIALPSPQSGNLPVGPADTVSQVLFTDDEKFVIVVVKSQVDSSGKVIAPGYIISYPFSTSNGLGTPVKSTISGTALLFGCTFQYNSYNLFCADSGIGAVYLTQSNMKYTVSQSTPKTSFGGGTACWTTRSPLSGGPFYLSAVDRNFIAAFDASTGKITRNNIFTTGLGAPNAQLIELQASASFVYGLSFGNQTAGQHIFVAQDAQTNGQLTAVQEVTLKGFSTSIEGLALFNVDDTPRDCDFGGP